jgi:predicted PurR-regulated permease PerM
MQRRGVHKVLAIALAIVLGFLIVVHFIFYIYPGNEFWRKSADVESEV